MTAPSSSRCSISQVATGSERWSTTATATSTSQTSVGMSRSAQNPRLAALAEPRGLSLVSLLRSAIGIVIGVLAEDWVRR